MSYRGFRLHHMNGRVYVVNESGEGVSDHETVEGARAYIREVAERRALFRRELRTFDRYHNNGTGFHATVDNKTDKKRSPMEGSTGGRS